MPHTIDDSTATALVSLYATLIQRMRPADPVKLALEQLLEAEQARRGLPDAKTGALHPLALTQGSLLKEEFDVALHGPVEEWTVGALVADVKEMIHVNARHGFPVGDALLKALAGALRAAFPSARLVRLQGDAFAVLMAPTSGLRVSEEQRATALKHLEEAARSALPAGAEPPAFTVALLELTLLQPSHWQVLGPLVWAELERAYTLERLGHASGVQRRRLELQGFVPTAHGR